MVQRNLEQWTHLVEGLDLSRPVHTVTAKRIKRETGLEPRNMAYMDHSSSRPAVFRDNRLFLLPVKNGEYAIVKGEGYHSLEEDPKPPEDFQPELPLDELLLGPAGGEGAALAYAYNSGLTARVAKTPPLLLGRNDMFRLDPFDFRVNGDTPMLHQEGAIAQVDGFYFGGDSALLVECKTKRNADFLVRQLYFPYRHYQHRYRNSPVKNVRPFFVDFDESSGLFRFIEYKFDVLEDYTSIKKVDIHSFKVRPKLTAVHWLLDESLDPGLGSLTPQADRMDRVLALPLLVEKGYSDADRIAQDQQFDPRQSSYYRRAAELLGLVRAGKKEYELTELGRKFAAESEPERNKIAAGRMARIPVIHEVLERLYSREDAEVTSSEIEKILAQYDPVLHGSTLGRRRQTIVAWLRWLEQTQAVVKVLPGGKVTAGPRLVLTQSRSV